MYIYNSYTATTLQHNTSLSSTTEIAAAVPSRIRTLKMHIFIYIYMYMYIYIYIPYIHHNHDETHHIISVEDENSSSSALAHQDINNEYI